MLIALIMWQFFMYTVFTLAAWTVECAPYSANCGLIIDTEITILSCFAEGCALALSEDKMHILGTKNLLPAFPAGHGCARIVLSARVYFIKELPKPRY